MTDPGSCQTTPRPGAGKRGGRLWATGACSGFGGVLRGRLRERGELFRLGQLAMLLAHEPEPRTLRSVLAARVAAAHVQLATAQLARSTAIRSCAVAQSSPGQRGRDAVGEKLGKAVYERVEWMRRASGH